MSFSWRRISWLAVSLVLAGTACGDRPKDSDTAGPVGGPGQILYLTYCQSCHGVAGRGDGPAAASLRTPPTDLTRLWERYGSPLPQDVIADYIDGRQLMGFHASREMPIWGEEFFEDAPPRTPNLEGVRRRLLEVIVEYLDTLQSEQRS